MWKKTLTKKNKKSLYDDFLAKVKTAFMAPNSEKNFLRELKRMNFAQSRIINFGAKLLKEIFAQILKMSFPQN